MGLELYLNYVWALAASVSVGLWLRLGLRRFADRRQSFVGLFPSFVIVFPVISVSDDLWLIQNPA
jgi:uncharacterized membrane protein YhaH (DUF805 family)